MISPLQNLSCLRVVADCTKQIDTEGASSVREAVATEKHRGVEREQLETGAEVSFKQPGIH